MANPTSEEGVNRVPPAVEAFLRAVDRLAVIGGYLAAFCLFVLTWLMLAEIVTALLSRFIPSFPPDIPIAWEYSAYLMGSAFMLGSGLTLRAGAHIRVNAVLSSVSPTVRWWLETVTSFVVTLMACFLAWILSAFALRSFVTDQVSLSSHTPLWPPQSVLAIGAIILFVAALGRFVACLYRLPPDNAKLKVETVSE